MIRLSSLLFTYHKSQKYCQLSLLLRWRNAYVRGRNRYLLVRLVIILHERRKQVGVLLACRQGCNVPEQQQSGLTHLVLGTLFLRLPLPPNLMLLLVITLCQYTELFFYLVNFSDIDQGNVLMLVDFLKF